MHLAKIGENKTRIIPDVLADLQRGRKRCSKELHRLLNYKAQLERLAFVFGHVAESDKVSDKMPRPFATAQHLIEVMSVGASTGDLSQSHFSSQHDVGENIVKVMGNAPG
jgi:hypothetical protein